MLTTTALALGTVVIAVVHRPQQTNTTLALLTRTEIVAWTRLSAVPAAQLEPGRMTARLLRIPISGQSPIRPQRQADRTLLILSAQPYRLRARMIQQPADRAITIARAPLAKGMKAILETGNATMSTTTVLALGTVVTAAVPQRHRRSTLLALSTRTETVAWILRSAEVAAPRLEAGQMIARLRQIRISGQSRIPLQVARDDRTLPILSAQPCRSHAQMAQRLVARATTIARAPLAKEMRTILETENVTMSITIVHALGTVVIAVALQRRRDSILPALLTRTEIVA